MSNNDNGSYILKLLVSLTPDPLSESVQALYHEADSARAKDPQRAIELCQKALGIVDRLSAAIIGTSEAKAYARGRYHLLMASIYLGQDPNVTSTVLGDDALRKAEEYYIQSQRQFHLMQWSHLESLAYLGLAITQRKLNKFNEASRACENAQQYIDDYSVPFQIDKTELRQAITKERGGIQEALSPEVESPVEVVEDRPGEKELPVFNISSGDGIIAIGSTARLNLLAREDYERKNILAPPDRCVIDLNNYPQGEKANYILEIDEKVKAVDGLQHSDWVLIEGEKDPGKLSNGTIVAVLERRGGTTYASLKALIKYKDHYFLRAQDESTTSIVVAPYGADLSKLEAYYSIDGKTIIGKRIDDIQVCGAVIEGPIQQNFGRKVKVFKWTVPLVDMGSGDIIDHKYFWEDQRKDANYLVITVPDSSMANDGILEGQTALFRRQKNVARGKIALLLITTPNSSLRVIRYYYYRERTNQPHWFFRSNTPGSESLLVIPKGVDNKPVEQIYLGSAGIGNFITYKDAEVTIIGEYTKLVDHDLIEPAYF